MHHRWCLVAYAHVQAMVVVEMDEVRYKILHVLIRMQLLLPVEAFHLYYTVGTLGNGVICRFVILTHGYADVVCLERSHVGIAAVLYPSVGVMYQSLERLAARHGHCLFYSHF